MTLNQLSALVAVVECRSIHSAAKSLGISRTTLDTLIRDLETSLGLNLLIRTPMGTSLTAPGESLLPRARRLLADAAVLETAFREEALSAPRVVHLQLSIALPPLAHVLAISALTDLNPDLRFRISFVESDGAPLSEDIHMRLQFGGIPAAGPFRTFLLARTPVKLQASASYLAQRKPPGSLEELASHRLLLWSGRGDRDTSLPLAEGGHWEVVPYLSSPDANLVRMLVSRGVGIGFLPAPSEAIPDLDEPLKELLPDRVKGMVAVRAIIPERLAELEATRRVMETTKELSRLYNAGDLVWERES